MASDPWVFELIPDEDLLYMRAHKSFYRSGSLQPGVFRDIEGAMSTNWQKYCATAVEARCLARVPTDNGVVSFSVHTLRAIPLTVTHSPDESLPDRSHTDVIGEKSTEVRAKLLGLCALEMTPS